MAKKPVEAQLSKFQNFRVERIHRSKLKNAAYNPRTISKEARANLKTILQTHGLVESVTWNKRTGNIVGGHQRLDILDSLEKSQNYLLDVNVIDVPLMAEKKINLSLNNVAAMGDFDPEKVLQIVKDAKKENTTLEDAGFSRRDLELILADLPEADTIFSPERAGSGLQGLLKEMHEIDDHVGEARKAKREASEPGNPTPAMVSKIKEMKESWKETRENKEDTEYYVVFVFETRAQKESALDALKVDKSERYVDGKMLMKKLGFKGS